MDTKKITQEAIIDAIEKTAQAMIRKYELYESIKNINEELKVLYESAPPMVGSFGFKTPTDAAKNISGFVEQPNISFIAQLEKEMGIENSEQINEVEILKMENEKLKKELDELKSSQNNSTINEKANVTAKGSITTETVPAVGTTTSTVAK